MTGRGYTLLDFDTARLGDDPDLVVRFLEYVRANFHAIVPNVPSNCELDLLAGRTAHNVSQVLPLLGLYAPPEVRNDVPDWGLMIDAINSRCSVQPKESLFALVQSTQAPSWAELQQFGVYPNRRNA